MISELLSSALRARDEAIALAGVRVVRDGQLLRDALPADVWLEEPTNDQLRCLRDAYQAAITLTPEEAYLHACLLAEAEGGR